VAGGPGGERRERARPGRAVAVEATRPSAPMTIDTSRAATEASAGDPGGLSRNKTELRRFLQLFVLGGFVFPQPLFDVAGRSPDFFLFRRAGAADILVLVALSVLGPPLLLWAGAALGGLGSCR